MKKEKKYLFTQWSEWHDTISEAIDDFFLTFSVYPEILESNNHTFSQFDFLINITPGEIDKLKKTDELTNKTSKPSKNEYVGVSSFETKRCSLDFAVNEDLENKQFNLIYDTDADWDDGDIILDVPVEKEEKVTI
jgi:hypothetical protein